eukprot:CAMPEP_0196584790 /NCGR_PEP_ID=MMETSP1081-20130531/48483_1 /TAXON_ID=36882 /ORGANISM="Pyramimonas amylifera, Strain CCMP720" /LENGTH=139 /DNA_ID=CAMNT_0041906133 /DNA_START=326 /DNA_END=745 /DNA_ORIENTATION=+
MEFDDPEEELQAPESQDAASEDSPEWKLAINQLANRCLRVMLSENLMQVYKQQAEVDEVGKLLVGSGKRQSILFCYVLRRMLDHEVPEEADSLKGEFRVGFEKLYGVVEESGWTLETIYDPEESEEEDTALVGNSDYGM